MKLTKNRVFCQQCGRFKIQLSTEREAVHFMKYNVESMREETGRVPIRAYYCNTCGCWYLISKSLRPYIAKTKYSLVHYEREMEKNEKAAIRSAIKRIKSILHE